MSTTRTTIRLTAEELAAVIQAAEAAGTDRCTAIRAAIRRLYRQPLKPAECQRLPTGYQVIPQPSGRQKKIPENPD